MLASAGVVADNVYRGKIHAKSIMGVFTIVLYVVSDDHAGWLLVKMKNRLKICDSSTSETDFNFTCADYVYENGVDVKYEKRTRHLVTFRYAEKKISRNERILSYEEELPSSSWRRRNSHSVIFIFPH